MIEVELKMPTSISSEHAIALPLAADGVWQKMRQYEDLSWALKAGIEEVQPVGTGIGMVRKVRMAGTSEWINERLVAMDEDAMSFSYVIDGDGWPGLKDYVATAKVVPGDQGCQLRWLMHAKVEDEDAEELQAGLDAMAEGIVTLFADQFETQ
jgi:carbon monoxide dehydrogenase subunit G